MNGGDGYTENQGDTDDEDSNVNPGATEILNNRKDDDSNSFTPDDLSDQPFPCKYSFQNIIS